jgi:hypothetical protein
LRLWCGCEFEFRLRFDGADGVVCQSEWRGCVFVLVATGFDGFLDKRWFGSAFVLNNFLTLRKVGCAFGLNFVLNDFLTLRCLGYLRLFVGCLSCEGLFGNLIVT